MSNKISRRTILLRGIQVPIGGFLALGLSACGGNDSAGKAAGNVCADLDAMTDGERSSRRSLDYQEISPQPGEVCADCAFYHAAEACGTCDMFNGGPVNPKGRCDSWSAKA